MGWFDTDGGSGGSGGDVAVTSIAAGDNNIGNVDVVTLPALVASTAAIGKLAANSGVTIGAVELAASQTVGLAVGSAAFGKLSANTAATYIGDVVVALATTPFQATDTLTTAGTRQTLASHGSNVFGFYITNTHASATVYIGVAATVSSTAFIFRLAPGQSTPLIPLANSNVLGFDASANSATISYGGF